MLNGVLSPALPFKVLEQAIPPASVSLVADSKTGSLEARHGDATHSDTEVDFFYRCDKGGAGSDRWSAGVPLRACTLRTRAEQTKRVGFKGAGRPWDHGWGLLHFELENSKTAESGEQDRRIEQVSSRKER